MTIGVELLLPDYVRILYLLHSFEGREDGGIKGTKKFQKMVWFSRVEGNVRFTYEFNALTTFWPPYDEDLNNDLKLLCDTGFIKSDLHLEKDRIGHLYKLSDKGKNFLELSERVQPANPISEEEKASMREIVNLYGGLSDSDITLIALHRWREYMKEKEKGE